MAVIMKYLPFSKMVISTSILVESSFLLRNVVYVNQNTF